MKMFSSLMSLIVYFKRKFTGGYRPERHYMRGPGPASSGKSRTQSQGGKQATGVEPTSNEK